MKKIKAFDFWMGVLVTLVCAGMIFCIAMSVKSDEEIIEKIRNKPKVELYSDPPTDEEIIIELINSFSKRLEYVELHTTLDENGVTTIDLKMQLYSRVAQ